MNLEERFEAHMKNFENLQAQNEEMQKPKCLAKEATW